MRFHISTMSLLVILVTASLARGGPFAPQVGQPGSTAIDGDSPLFTEWASGYQDLVRGPQDIANPTGPTASFGTGASALGPAGGSGVVSLGDGGQITLTFDHPIANGAGADFAVFENGFTLGSAGLAYLELGFVEVSSDGTDFFRFPSVSETQTSTQVGGFGPLEASDLHDMAGKYIGGYGTPFDLGELAGVSPLLNVDAVRYVKIADVVGSIDPSLGSRDSRGHLINDPYATPFATGGFDLDAVGVLHMSTVPEPASLVMLVVGLGTVGLIVAKERGPRLSREPQRQEGHLRSSDN